jgi:hypothetical protein
VLSAARRYILEKQGGTKKVGTDWGRKRNEKTGLDEVGPTSKTTKRGESLY